MAKQSRARRGEAERGGAWHGITFQGFKILGFAKRCVAGLSKVKHGTAMVILENLNSGARALQSKTKHGLAGRSTT